MRTKLDLDALIEDEAEAAMIQQWGREDMDYEARLYEQEAAQEAQAAAWQGPPMAEVDIDPANLPF